MFNILTAFFIIWLHLVTRSNTLSLPNDYIHFGGNEEESRQAAYYLSADSGLNIGPTDELKRTQRFLLRNLFGNKQFKDCNNCCNNNYNVGNGDSYNSMPPLTLPLPFQPWKSKPLPLWSPLPSLFGPPKSNNNYASNSYSEGNYNNYPPPPLPAPSPPNYISNNNYASSPDSEVNSNNYPPPPAPSPANYNSNSYNSLPPAPTPSYEDIRNENPTTEVSNRVPEPVYDTPPAPIPVYKPDNIENLYEAPLKPLPLVNENPFVLPQTPAYNQNSFPAITSQNNGKLPQLVYQPIIFVSPYHMDKNLTPIKQKLDENEEEASKSNKFLSENEEPKKPNLNNEESKANIPQSNESPAPAVQQHQQLPQLLQPNPKISTVASVYNIISPSFPTRHIPNIPCYSGDLNQYSFTHIYATAPPQLPVTYSPLAARAPIPAPLVQLTTDDQPYRTCPELFEEYQRKLNTYGYYF